MRGQQILRGMAAGVTGLGVVALAGAGVAAGLIKPAPPEQDVPPESVNVGAAPLRLVCPPAPVVPTATGGGDIDYDKQFGTGGGVDSLRSQVSVLGRDGQAAPATGGVVGADGGTIEANGTMRLFQSKEAAPVRVVAQPSGNDTALAAGASVARGNSGDLRGLAAGSCTEPSSSSWLVGGSTEPGSSARLTLANPGPTAVEVTAHVWGATGPLEDPVTVTVGAHEIAQVLLESVSKEPRLAVHLSVAGGNVAASIQDTILNGLAPAGTATVTPTEAPQRQLTIGPVPIDGKSGQATLRLVNPGQEVANVAVDVLGDKGTHPLGGAQDLKIDPGTVVDVALAGIDPGEVSIAVQSDQPLSGAVVVSRTGKPSQKDPAQKVRDRAWLPATVPTGHGLLPVVGLGDFVGSARVAVANPAEQKASVTLRPVSADGTAGDPVEVTVASGATTTVGKDLDLASAVAVQVTGDPVLASLTLRASPQSGPLIGLLAMTPDANSEQSVQVRLGRF